jgi:hypothetical protein
LPLKEGNIDKDNWFGGFIDVSGNFYIRHTILEKENTIKKINISCRFRIEQKQSESKNYENNSSILFNIAKFLKCSLKTRKQKSTNNNYLILSASKYISLLIILKYFNSYFLYSSKYFDYLE